MIRGVLSDGTLLIGLSRENVKRLVEGKPIKHEALPSSREGGSDFPPLIMVFGETEQELVRTFRRLWPEGEPAPRH